MARLVRVNEFAGRTIVGKRFEDGELYLRVEGEKDEVVLQCVCDKTHFYVTEAERSIRVVCHGCATRATLTLGPLRS